MAETGFLFCLDPLRPSRTDPEFAREAAAARRAGARIALIDHDALLGGDLERAVGGVRRESGPYRYRGWMIPSARYAELERVLADRGCTLRTSGADYRTAHELPGWYEVFEGLTPRSVWRPLSPGEPLPGAVVWAGLAQGLGSGPGIVKDYVKSRKHEWDEACFVPELTDRERLAAVIRRFVELQEDFLAGGVVVRAFEPFVPGGEARVWWVAGEPVRVTAHPDTPGQLPAPRLDAVGEAVRALGCGWVTTDLALREDGVWRVVEVGDGQVSGLPAGDDGEGLFSLLTGA
ncbi:ATP-grasp domain-containing protein [Streptomyces sp. NPDC059166]|uniref:ATP-grasp domain-containing protein n=1 Tax=Streptomyces sp. NPDC059166 TaxID=3346752 RepID=UPI0036957CC6